MSAAGERCYEIHGVGVAVSSSEPAVLEAMDLRLRDFRHETGLPRVDVRFEFAIGADGIEPPPGSGRPVYDTPHGSLYYFPEADALCGEFAGVSLCCEPGRGVALLQSERFSGRELYLATHPLTTVSLMELLERRGLFSLHAACVATKDGAGVLLAGPSGAGKSTLALALARAGMSFLSDDVVFLARAREGGGALRVLGFADTIGVTDRTAERFDELLALLVEPPTPGFPKRLRRIEELFGAPAVRSCAPVALVFPEVRGDRPSRILELDPKEAMLRLVPDVLLTQAASTRAHLEAIAALLAQVRCYEIHSGVDLEQAANLVRELV